MKKVKDSMGKRKINKKISFMEISVFVLIVFIAMTGLVFTQNIYNLDTMWVFSFASKIADGAVPYADFNMVMTPLSSQITAIFLKMFGNTMMVSAFIGVIYGTLIFLLQYLILRKVNISRKISFGVVLMSILFMGNTIGDSYNILAILLVHIIIYLEICKIRYDKYVRLLNKEKYLFKNKQVLSYRFIYNMCTGIILGLIFLAKQNIGVIAILAITVYYFSKCIYKELKFKQAFGELTIKAIFCIIPIGIEVIYLFLSGALYQFIDYTILGLSNFSNKVNGNILTSMFTFSITDTGNIVFVIKNVLVKLESLIRNALMTFSLLFLPIMIWLKASKKLRTKNKLDIDIMVLSFCFMFVGLIVSVPLPNEYHLILTGTFIIFLFMINIMQILPISNCLNRSMSKLTIAIIVLVLLTIGVGNLIIYSQVANKSEFEKFKGMYISYHLEESINDVVNYINTYEQENGHRIYMITSKSAIHSLAMNINNGIFDLPQYGNLGKEDYRTVINKLDSMNNFAVMIYADENDLFWQEPKEIMEYIIQNYEYVDEFDIYKIYYKP